MNKNIITVIGVVIVGIMITCVFSIILQGTVYESDEYKIQNLTPKYKTTIHITGDYMDTNTTIGEFPPITTNLNWKASKYLYEIKQVYPLKLENIDRTIKGFFNEKPKVVLEIIPKEGIYDLILKKRFEGEENILHSKTIRENGETLNDAYTSYCRFYPFPKKGEFAGIERKFGTYILPQDGPSFNPYRSWMLFLDENFSWEFEMTSEVNYDNVQSIHCVNGNNTYTSGGGIFTYRKVNVKYHVEGIENINGRNCFKVGIYQEQELEPIQPKNKNETEQLLQEYQQLPINISNTQYSVMWIDKNERILVKSIDSSPPFYFEQTLK